MAVETNGEDLSIGEMARVTGLGIHTLRYYERIGLIEPVPRLDNGHRRYASRTVERAQALSYLRASGMSVDDMRSYLRNVDDSAATKVAVLLARHAEDLDRQIKDLAVRREYVTAKAAYWQAVAEGRGDDPVAQQQIERATELSKELR